MRSAIAMLAIPWPIKTSCSIVLEPQVHRLVSAPFDGVFDQSRVLPGDEVQAGQLLGQMDGREVRTHLAALQADLARARKSRDSNLAAGKLADAQIDRLQSERLQHEQAVWLRKQEQVEIRSPISGIVVSGDLKRNEGAAVKLGQSLYAVAPLAHLNAEFAIPEEDLELVSLDAKVSLRLDALPGSHWSAEIDRIDPRRRASREPASVRCRSGTRE